MITVGDCRTILRMMPDASVDSVVTDPPYGLSRQPDAAEVLRHWLAGDDYHGTGAGFMGKTWDSFVPGPATFKEVYRVLKPGGHLLAFAGTRTQDLMAMSLRLAGFEIRDMIAWAYGSGFPKSHDVAKGVDKALGTPATDAARQWEGWGTALKPALEPVTVARKPLDGTVAANVMRHGTGAVNIDGCRVGDTGGTAKGSIPKKGRSNTYGDGLNGNYNIVSINKGRHPANLIHDGSLQFPNDAQRFFYHAKASKADRNDGLGGAEPKPTAASEFRPNHAEKAAQGDDGNPYGRWTPQANNHPTVKPTELMRYLCRLVTPPGGTVLDPFAGSGSTGRGAVLEGFKFIGVEMSPEYAEIARARIAAVE